MAPADKSSKFVLLVACSLIVLNLFCIDPVHALDLGLKVKGPVKALVKHFNCSRKCESEFCKDGYGYINRECSLNLLKCMEKVKKSGAKTFKGSKCKAGEVIDVITDVIKVAVRAGRFVPPSK
ncbi:phospholipase A2-alpha-like [Carya illinoinensis]|uniref:phospholipase A2-alpha-like n=1 Tax=Carya illinoinensis TaxID=32201 RepID=UPI001C728BF1|nr:phospholipase A2-alpha-like [Carya illinoinensis]